MQNFAPSSALRLFSKAMSKRLSKSKHAAGHDAPCRSSMLESLEPRRLMAASLKGTLPSSPIGGVPVGTTSPGTVLPAYIDKLGIANSINPVPTFADEFDGTSLDPTKWQIREADRHRIDPNSDQFAATTADAVQVSNGELSLVAHNDPVTGKFESGWIQTATNNGDTGGLVPGRSANFTQAFGYWEAKLKMSSVSGMWNAFWVHASQMPSVGDDPAKANHPEIYGTEMDVVEQSAVRIDAGSGNTVHTTTHANGYASQHISSSAHTNVATLSTASPVEQYHIYGLLWTPTSVNVYMDGTLTYVETNPNLVSKVAHVAILSNEIGAPGSKTLGAGRLSWGAVPAGGYGSVQSSQARLTADYVRVWSLTGVPIPTPPVPTPEPTPPVSQPKPRLPVMKPIDYVPPIKRTGGGVIVRIDLGVDFGTKQDDVLPVAFI